MMSFRRLIAFTTLVAALSVRASVEIPESLKSRIPPPDLEATAWILQDFNSGWVIASSNADERLDPASISKLMTAYIVFGEIKQGNLSFEDEVHISEKAWRTKGSRMFVEVNSRVNVENLLKGLIVQSGNDAAVALAEHVAGSEQGFAELMNKTAQQLGLKNTQYQNSTGLPEDGHYSSARDISELTRALIRDFPELYKIYSIREFTYNKITQGNRNALLWRDDSVDGVKTGHTENAGYCLVGSANRDGLRLIATVMGTKSKAYRADAVHSLLKHGFSGYEGFRLYDNDKTITRKPVYKGNVTEVDVRVAEPLHVVVAKGSAQEMKADVKINEPLMAPLSVGTEIGVLNLIFKSEVIGSFPLVAGTAVETGSFFGNMIDSVKLWFH